MIIWNYWEKWLKQWVFTIFSHDNYVRILDVESEENDNIGRCNTVLSVWGQRYRKIIPQSSHEKTNWEDCKNGLNSGFLSILSYYHVPLENVIRLVIIMSAASNHYALCITNWKSSLSHKFLQQNNNLFAGGKSEKIGEKLAFFGWQREIDFV